MEALAAGLALDSCERKVLAHIWSKFVATPDELPPAEILPNVAAFIATHKAAFAELAKCTPGSQLPMWLEHGQSAPPQ